MSKRQRFLLIAAAGILFGLTMAYLLSGYSQSRAKDEIISLLAALGFSEIELSNPETAPGLLHYTGIRLDQDNFSYIRELTLNYNPLTGHFRRLTVTGLSLTGNTDQHGHIRLAGWTKPETLPPLTALPGRISIKDAEIALLTDLYGGITLDFNIEGHNKNEGYEFYTEMQSRQKNLRFRLSGQGQYAADKSWRGQATLNRAKIAAGPVKLTRMTGTLSFQGRELDNYSVETDFQAGGLALYDIPWTNTSIKLAAAPGKTEIALEAAYLKNPSLELRLAARRKNQITIAGILNALSGTDFVDFLHRHGLSALSAEETEKLNQTGPLKIHFALPDPKESKLIYKIKNTEDKIDIIEEIKFKT